MVVHSPISWWCWDVINVTLADEDASKKIIYVEVGVEDGFGNCSMTAGNLATAWQHFQSLVTDWTFSGHSLKLVFLQVFRYTKALNSWVYCPFGSIICFTLALIPGALYYQNTSVYICPPLHAQQPQPFFKLHLKISISNDNKVNHENR